MSQKTKGIIWILVPFIYGYLANVFLFLILQPIFSQIIFGIFWFWVGMRYANLNGSKIKNFLIGNSIWLISFVMFIWQFVILNDKNKNLFFAGISQYYIISFIASGTGIYELFVNTNVYNVDPILIISFINMLLVFGAGFIYETFKGRYKEKQVG